MKLKFNRQEVRLRIEPQVAHVTSLWFTDEQGCLAAPLNQSPNCCKASIRTRVTFKVTPHWNIRRPNKGKWANVRPGIFFFFNFPYKPPGTICVLARGSGSVQITWCPNVSKPLKELLTANLNFYRTSHPTITAICINNICQLSASRKLCLLKKMHNII